MCKSRKKPLINQAFKKVHKFIENNIVDLSEKQKAKIRKKMWDAIKEIIVETVSESAAKIAKENLEDRI